MVHQLFVPPAPPPPPSDPVANGSQMKNQQKLARDLVGDLLRAGRTRPSLVKAGDYNHGWGIPAGYGHGQGGPYGTMNGGRLPPNALGPGYPNTQATPFGGDGYMPGAYGYAPGYSPPVGYGGQGDQYGGGGYGNPYGGGAGGGYGGGGGLPAQPGGGPMGVLARRQQQLDSLLAAGQIHPKDYARHKAAIERAPAPGQDRHPSSMVSPFRAEVSGGAAGQTRATSRGTSRRGGPGPPQGLPGHAPASGRGPAPDPAGGLRLGAGAGQRGTSVPVR